MVYQVYLNWTGNQYSGREILVFANRQRADEFYNRCIETNAATTANPLTDITRHTPQFWSFFMSAESRPFYFAESNAKDLIPTYMAARIGGYDNMGLMPVIPNDPTGSTEYRSGGSYYIRTKAAPHLYWFYNSKSEEVQLSSTIRSKFRIDRETTGTKSDEDPRRVLVPKDTVRVTALSAHTAPHVGVNGNNHVSTSQSTHQFTFGSFYSGDFGVDWSTLNGIEAYISYDVSYAGDEWELVD